MKKIIVDLLFVVIFIISIALLSSCNNIAEPQESQRLIIENGFYKKVETKNPYEIIYAIEFTYYLRDGNCNWGGYYIKMDSLSWIIDLYKMQTMESPKKYQWLDTFKVYDILKTNPVVKMQGYRISGSKTYDELYAEYILQPK